MFPCEWARIFLDVVHCTKFQLLALIHLRYLQYGTIPSTKPALALSPFFVRERGAYIVIRVIEASHFTIVPLSVYPIQGGYRTHKRQTFTDTN
jgi:hypothetical protein